MSDEKRSLKDVWRGLTPGMRLAVMGGGLLLFAVLALLMMPGSEKPRRTPDQKPIKAEMLLPKAQDRTVEQLSGGLTATDKEVQRIRRDIERLKEERSALRRQIQDALVSMKTNEPTDAGISAEILAEIQKLKRRQDEIDARE